MNENYIELLFILLFLMCLGVYWIGKKKGIDWARGLGKNGAIVLFIMIIVDIVFLRRDIFRS